MAKINLQEKLLNLHGQPVPKSNPSKEEIKELEKHDKVKNQYNQEILDQNYLPDETIGNFLVSCLSAYKSNDLRDWTMVILISGKIIDCKTKELELQDKYVKFLCNVLADVTMREETEKKKVPGNTPKDKEKEVETKVQKGIYMPWATMRCRLLLKDPSIKE